MNIKQALVNNLKIFKLIFSMIFTFFASYFVGYYIYNMSAVTQVSLVNTTCNGKASFHCGDGECVNKTDYCYGTVECSNKALFNCLDVECPEYAYRCFNSRCFDREVIKCNAISECSPDLSPRDLDELYDACPTLQEDCGIFFSEDRRDIFPWHAGIWQETAEDPIKICAATIITPRFIVSAADCFWNYTTNALSDQKFVITTQVANNTFQQIKRVKKIHLNNFHSSENESNINNIAVIEVAQPFQFNEDVYAVCILDHNLTTSHDFRYYVEATYAEEMTTWTPGPNIYNGPSRLHLYTNINDNPIVNDDYRSEIPNVTKYLRATGKCGPISDHGGGTFILVRNRYYFKGIINPPIGDLTIMSCLYRILTYVSPQLDFIRSVVTSPTIDQTDLIENLDENSDKYHLNVDLVHPKALYNNCGKFDIFDEKSPFPWYGVIWLERAERPEVVCAHTIIKENMVISAASCFWNTSSDSIQRGSYMATAGFNGTDFAQFKKVARIITQDYFSTESESHINNIAFLVLEEPIIFDNAVGAACLYNVDVVPTIPAPIEREAIMNILQSCGPGEEKWQIVMEFVWNSRCFENISLVPETYKLCMNVLFNNFDDKNCLTPSDTGSGLFVIDEGLYFLRGILNPRATLAHLVFTNVLPYVPSIAARLNDFQDLDPKIVIAKTDDLPKLYNLTVNSEINSALYFLYDFGDCENQHVEENCESDTSCDFDSVGEYECTKNKTMQKCSFMFCSDGSTCNRAVYCG